MAKKLPKLIPGLKWRGTKNPTIWIHKQILGIEIQESTGTDQPKEAEQLLAKRIDEIRRGKKFGETRAYSFDEAAARFILELEKDKSVSASTLRQYIRQLDARIVPFFGDHNLLSINAPEVKKFITQCRSKQLRTKSIKNDTTLISQILRLASTEWYDEITGQPWIPYKPAIVHPKPIVNTKDDIESDNKMDKKIKHPLSTEKEEILISLLPKHQQLMAIFCINTGLRDSNLCGLQWGWETHIEGYKESVFVIPAPYMKGKRHPFTLVLNSTARAILEGQRGKHKQWVFPYKGNCLNSLNQESFRDAWTRAGLPDGVNDLHGPHNLRHTFATRLRAKGADERDIADLLHHIPTSVTSVYSAPTLCRLRETVELLVTKQKLRAVK